MRIARLLSDRSASAAAETAMVTPLLLALMFGSFELGNFFLDEHALQKHVRDGARFAARLELDEDYDCPSTVFADPGATAQIIKVTKDGVVSGAGQPRWDSYWDRTCTGETQTLEVEFKCVDKTDIDTDDTGNTGIYTALDGEIPVVRVAAAVRYRSVLSTLGFDTANICMRAESEAAVQGL